ncbi:MAG: threonine ammonia-lyase [Veillonellaceae bacterium]|nr:threonine ammonia-lyase [Veillonellaceae bacterium]
MRKLYNFMEARERLSTVARKTELIPSSVFSERCDNEVYIKAENLQHTGSFKVRGAYNKMAKLTEEEKKRGVITSSAGNHAQGVALAAQRLGIKAVIVMPKHTPVIKVEATKKFGAEIVLAGEIYDEAYAKAVELQKEHGYTFVHPFDDEDVIEGQGTIALDIMEDLPDVDIMLVPIGGGGLVSGIAAAAKQKNPMVKIIGVEPEGAACMKAALAHGGPIPLDVVNTIADGTAVRTAGKITYEYVKQFVDEIITVSDYELMEAFLLLVEKHKLVGENAGILSLAGLQKLKEHGKKVVSVLSGGNIDVLTIAAMINKGLVVRDRICTFAINLPDKPGQLMKVARILGEQNANVIKLDHNQFKNLNRFSEVELFVTIETNGKEHVQRVIDALHKEGLQVQRVNTPEDAIG